MLGRVGLSYAPANAVREVRQAVDVVLERSGGDACVREMVEHLLGLRGQWSELADSFR